MDRLRKNTTLVAIILILIIGAWFRLTWYGDLRLSVGHADTSSYIEGSKAPFFSWKIFSGKRLFTTNILYKLANDAEKCPLTAYSEPFWGREVFRANQSCFDKITYLQNILAVFGWCFFAWTTSRWLKTPFIKITAVVLIFLFAFTPQIAEWDSLLSPESLTFSLLIIAFSLLQEIAFRAILTADQNLNIIQDRLLIPAFLIIYLLWVFVRDVHLYSIIILLFLIAPLFFLKKFRGSKRLISVSVILIFFFFLGYVSSKVSLRATHSPLEHAFNAYIWPYPQRVQFIKQFGMPEKESPEFESWFDANATKTYGLFLMSHPGFVITTLWDNMDQFKSDFIQPYFITTDIKYHKFLLVLGEIFHPETSAVFLIDLLLWMALGLKAFKYPKHSISAWFWLASWIFFTSIITLLATFFGDIDGTRRHIFPSVEMLRLFLWVFLLPLFDFPGEQI